MRIEFWKSANLGRCLAPMGLSLLTAFFASTAFAQTSFTPAPAQTPAPTQTPVPTPSAADPASEPAVLAVAKVLPAVVNINTERVVRRTVLDPIDDFYSQFFGYNRFRPREIRQTLQSLGSSFIIDPAGYIVTNQHVVERAADLKIHVTTNDGKTYHAH